MYTFYKILLFFVVGPILTYFGPSCKPNRSKSISRRIRYTTSSDIGICRLSAKALRPSLSASLILITIFEVFVFGFSIVASPYLPVKPVGQPVSL